jgi:hypothetical protein
MVAVGTKPSSVFTQDDTGATRSMIMGCIVMESKYIAFLNRGYSRDAAMQLAISGYLGKTGARDVLGSSPEERLAMVNGTLGNSNITTLAKAGFSKSNTLSMVLASNQVPQKTAENRTTTVATSNNTAPVLGGCTQAVA